MLLFTEKLNRFIFFNLKQLTLLFVFRFSTMKNNNNQRRTRRRKVDPADPPVVVTEPFNDIVLIYPLPITDAWYKHSTILATLNTQLGLELTDIVVKLKKVQAWGEAGGKTPIGLQVFSPIQTSDEEPDPTITKQDSPGTNRRAHISYKFDAMTSKIPIRVLKDQADGYLFGISGAVECIHLHIVWRTHHFKPSSATRTIVG